MTTLSYDALSELLLMIEYSEAAEKLSNEQLAKILIEQVWAELPISSPASALISEIAHRLAPQLSEDEDAWPTIPDLEGVDIFAEKYGAPTGEPDAT